MNERNEYDYNDTALAIIGKDVPLTPHVMRAFANLVDAIKIDIPDVRVHVQNSWGNEKVIAWTPETEKHKTERWLQAERYYQQQQQEKADA